ncbi:polysaccharide deacetylase family protein [uncultured Tateyamaria sp.]|uniref:polysaccharide deacetylase family protein n=1 Tax=uncultured Tateyamaria sp. TaxID=455651 RepID=UPI00262B8058|nr:polysaccharide deacetylase family protein [uncultured Tateyamaria sp.]
MHRLAGALGAIIVVMHVTAIGAAASQETSQANEERREIALSFDDAPRLDGTLLSGTDRTSRLIAELARAGVEGAGFFVLAGNITKAENGAERLRAYQAAGHFLANHTDTHPSLSRTSAEEFLADVDVASEALASFENTLDLFRYPYLQEGDDRIKQAAVEDGLAERGLRNGYITVDNYDWYLQALVDEAVAANHPLDLSVLGQTYVELLVDTVEFYDSIAQETLARSPRHVLLLHENDIAALFIYDLVLGLRDAGWDIIPLDAAYQDEIADKVPNTLFRGQGRVSALAHAAGRAPRELVHIAEDESYLRALFEERGLVP